MAQLMLLTLTVSCFSKIQIGFTFLVPASLGSPGKRAIKRVYVCDNVKITYCLSKSSQHVPTNCWNKVLQLAPHTAHSVQLAACCFDTVG